ncbi:MAG: hypothetical protein ACOC32_01415, partial [Nanoarchaeota archaeon]
CFDASDLGKSSAEIINDVVDTVVGRIDIVCVGGDAGIDLVDEICKVSYELPNVINFFIDVINVVLLFVIAFVVVVELVLVAAQRIHAAGQQSEREKEHEHNAHVSKKCFHFCLLGW